MRRTLRGIIEAVEKSERYVVGAVGKRGRDGLKEGLLGRRS